MDYIGYDKCFQLVKSLSALQEILVRFLGREDPLEKREATHSGILVLSFCGSAGKNSPAMRETWVQSLGWEGLMQKGKATYSLQYSVLENSMDYSSWDHKELDPTERLSLHFREFTHHLYPSQQYW